MAKASSLANLRPRHYAPGEEVPFAKRFSKWEASQLLDIIKWLEGNRHRTIVQAAEHFSLPKSALQSALQYWSKQIALGRFPIEKEKIAVPTVEQIEQARLAEQKGKHSASRVRLGLSQSLASAKGLGKVKD